MNSKNDERSSDPIYADITFDEIIEYLKTHSKIRVILPDPTRNCKYFRELGFSAISHRLGLTPELKCFWYSIISVDPI